MTFTPSGVTQEDWGSFQIVFNGTDITYFRGIRTLIDKMTFSEPYGEGVAQITIPSVTEYDAFSGSLDWLKPGRNVDIYHVMPNGTTIYPYWHGFASSIEVSSEPGTVSAISIQLLGALVGEATLRVHQPQFLDKVRDIGSVLSEALRPEAYSRPIAPFRFTFQSTTTGLDTRKRGSRTQTVLDWCDEVLSLAQGPSGTQWTISRAFTGNYPTQARSYYLRAKTPVQTNTVTAGGRGVVLSLVRDITEHPNALYGEGVAPSGERWRNAKYPNLGSQPKPTYPGSPVTFGDTDEMYSYDVVTVLQAEMRSDAWPAVQITGIFDSDTVTAVEAVQTEYGLTVNGNVNSATWDAIFDKANDDTALSSGYFRPLARRPAVEPYIYFADGSVKGMNDNYDPEIMRVENIISYGEGIKKDTAITDAERRNEREWSTGDWAGRITLTLDPEERSRFDIREGSTITVKHLLGQGPTGLTFHVSGIEMQPDADGQPVILTVDMKAYDLLALNARLQRNREAKRDPARSLASLRNRTSKPMKDVVGWDAESGAGVVKPHDLSAGWNVIKFVGAQYGSVEAIDATVYSPAQKFCLALFGKKISRSTLDSLVPSPLVMDDDDYGKWNVPSILDSLENYAFVEAWGDETEPAGYYPGRFSKDHAVTGRLVDTLGWTFGSQDPPWLWLAVWVPNGGSRFKATMRVSIQDQS